MSEYKPFIPKLNHELNRKIQEKAERQRIKDCWSYGEFLFLPAGVYELPQFCVCCNKKTKLRKIEGKINDAYLYFWQVWKLKKICRPKPTFLEKYYGSLQPIVAERMVKKLQILFPQLLLIEPSLGLALHILFIEIGFFLFHPTKYNPNFFYYLCPFHLFIKRLVIFLNWFLFISAITVFWLNSLIFSGNVLGVKISLVLLLSSIFCDICLNRIINTLFRVAYTDKNELVILGAGRKFLTVVKRSFL